LVYCVDKNLATLLQPTKVFKISKSFETKAGKLKVSQSEKVENKVAAVLPCLPASTRVARFLSVQYTNTG
jgi:hypothetical protein